jgi:hypothetical protein
MGAAAARVSSTIAGTLYVLRQTRSSTELISINFLRAAKIIVQAGV